MRISLSAPPYPHEFGKSFTNLRHIIISTIFWEARAMTLEMFDFKDADLKKLAACGF